MSGISGISSSKSSVDLKALFLEGYNQKKEEEEDKFVKSLQEFQNKPTASQNMDENTKTGDTSEPINPLTGEPLINIYDHVYIDSDGNWHAKEPEVNKILSAEETIAEMWENKKSDTNAELASKNSSSENSVENEKTSSTATTATITTATAILMTNNNNSRPDGRNQNISASNFANATAKYASQATMPSNSSSTPINTYV